jgi:hypothetical protein
VLVWLAVAFALGQPVWTSQHSRDLVAFGAFKGADVDPARPAEWVACAIVEPGPVATSCKTSV